MKIERIEDVTISYLRRVGEYGPANIELMEEFKAFLKSESLYDEQMILLGIALDNPETIPADKLRYDVGIVTDGAAIKGLANRQIADGNYAIFEVEHTAAGIQNFWENIGALAQEIPLDQQKPMFERYTLAKIDRHLCEFCLPLVEVG